MTDSHAATAEAAQILYHAMDVINSDAQRTLAHAISYLTGDTIGRVYVIFSASVR